jgi:hypothetical protein
MHTYTTAGLALWSLKRACEIQVVTHSMHGNTLPIIYAVSLEIVKGTAQDSLPCPPAYGAGENVLAALIRRADHIDASYRR